MNGHRTRVLAALAGEPVDRIPVSAWSHHFAMEASSESLAEQTIDYAQRFDWDGSGDEGDEAMQLLARHSIGADSPGDAHSTDVWPSVRAGSMDTPSTLRSSTKPARMH
ncbi:MAG: hypothetical protein KF809_19085 [Chloroflexi bacterium]|nr:hypothetical protein [Chloroflexota bacterium]